MSGRRGSARSLSDSSLFPPRSDSDSDASPLSDHSGYYASDDEENELLRFRPNISNQEQGYDSEEQSPDNMLTDPEEYVVAQPEEEGDDVAEIELDDEATKVPRADDGASINSFLHVALQLT